MRTGWTQGHALHLRTVRSLDFASTAVNRADLQTAEGPPAKHSGLAAMKADALGLEDKQEKLEDDLRNIKHTMCCKPDVVCKGEASQINAWAKRQQAANAWVAYQGSNTARRRAPLRNTLGDPQTDSRALPMKHDLGLGAMVGAGRCRKRRRGASRGCPCPEEPTAPNPSQCWETPLRCQGAQR